MLYMGQHFSPCNFKQCPLGWAQHTGLSAHLLAVMGAAGVKVCATVFVQTVAFSSPGCRTKSAGLFDN